MTRVSRFESAESTVPDFFASLSWKHGWTALAMGDSGGMIIKALHSGLMASKRAFMQVAAEDLGTIEPAMIASCGLSALHRTSFAVAGDALLIFMLSVSSPNQIVSFVFILCSWVFAVCRVCFYPHHNGEGVPSGSAFCPFLCKRWWCSWCLPHLNSRRSPFY